MFQHVSVHSDGIGFLRVAAGHWGAIREVLADRAPKLREQRPHGSWTRRPTCHSDVPGVESHAMRRVDSKPFKACLCVKNNRNCEAKIVQNMKTNWSPENMMTLLFKIWSGSLLSDGFVHVEVTAAAQHPQCCGQRKHSSIFNGFNGRSWKIYNFNIFQPKFVSFDTSASPTPLGWKSALLLWRSITVCRTWIDLPSHSVLQCVFTNNFEKHTHNIEAWLRLRKALQQLRIIDNNFSLLALFTRSLLIFSSFSRFVFFSPPQRPPALHLPQPLMPKTCALWELRSASAAWQNHKDQNSKKCLKRCLKTKIWNDFLQTS